MNAQTAVRFSTDYVLWLQTLKALGDKFPFAWKIILDMADDSKELYDLVLPTTPVPSTDDGQKLLARRGLPIDPQAFASIDTSKLVVTPEAEALEKQIANLHLQAAHPKLAEGIDWNTVIQTLRQLYTLLASNPALMALILQLLGIKPGGVVAPSA